MAIDIGNVLKDFSDAILDTLKPYKDRWNVKATFNEAQRVFKTLPILCVQGLGFSTDRALNPKQDRLRLEAAVLYYHVVPDVRDRINKGQLVAAEIYQILRQNRTLGGKVIDLDVSVALADVGEWEVRRGFIVGQAVISVIGYWDYVDVTWTGN